MRYPHGSADSYHDGLYANSTFFNFLLSRGKHAMAVLKDETRDLWGDAQSLFAGELYHCRGGLPPAPT